MSPQIGLTIAPDLAFVLALRRLVSSPHSFSSGMVFTPMISYLLVHPFDLDCGLLGGLIVWIFELPLWIVVFLGRVVSVLVRRAWRGSWSA